MKNKPNSDRHYMALAIQLAKQGLYTTSPNPRVGCILVKNNEIIGQGFHIKAGLGHAEVNAIADAKQRGNKIEGATAYVTLEPCSHFGRTPPCAQGLIDAKVARVVGAMTDPNPAVAGNGFNMLRAAGIEVVDHCLAAESAKLNPGFIKRMSQKMPYVRLKMATSLDGRTAMQSGESQWITGPEARAEVQKIRAQSCAIICGADSVLIDDPSMNVRISANCTDGSSQQIRQPLRVIIDSQHRVKAGAKIFTLAGKVMIASPVEPEHRISSEFCEVIYWQAKVNTHTDSPNQNKGPQVNLTSLLEQLASQGINEVLVETGAKLAGAFIQQDLVDELVMFTAPTLLGSDARPAFDLPFAKMEQQIRWSWQDVRMVGNDLKLILKRSIEEK